MGCLVFPREIFPDFSALIIVVPIVVPSFASYLPRYRDFETRTTAYSTTT